jgi:hypothetical protein
VEHRLATADPVASGRCSSRSVIIAACIFPRNSFPVDVKAPLRQRPAGQRGRRLGVPPRPRDSWARSGLPCHHRRLPSTGARTAQNRRLHWGPFGPLRMGPGSAHANRHLDSRYVTAAAYHSFGWRAGSQMAGSRQIATLCDLRLYNFKWQVKGRIGRFVRRRSRTEICHKSCCAWILRNDDQVECGSLPHLPNLPFGGESFHESFRNGV